ncbi:hypothetical protein GCM10010149_89460 [Nonomuraea roseoviolacea subsp. roseoviolacea]|uniref:hypothetical protein n=1 Tax=Nonomuraea roseoviolacea TaxID=103837 RepID=UPI0031D1AD16
MRLFRPASRMLPPLPPEPIPASLLPRKAVRIPKLLLPLLALVVIIALPVAAAVNVEALNHLGEKLYGSELAWTLPAVVVGYEFVSTGVYFMTPKLLPGLRRSAFVGAILGFVGTVALSILYTALYGSGDIELKIFMKPVPSLIAIAFTHMLVLVWHAKQEAAEVNASLEASSSLPPNDPPNEEEAPPAPSQAEIEAAIAAAVDAALAPVVAELAEAKAALRLRPAPRPRPRPERKQEAPAPVLPPEPVLPEEPVQEALVPETATKQEAEAEAPQEQKQEARLKSLPRVHDRHKIRALKLMEEAVAAGQDPMKLLPSKAKDRFPEDISNKQVGNALIVAKHLWMQGVRAADFSEAVAV